jgi:hypothetical protein
VVTVAPVAVVAGVVAGGEVVVVDATVVVVVGIVVVVVDVVEDVTGVVVVDGTAASVVAAGWVVPHAVRAERVRISKAALRGIRPRFKPPVLASPSYGHHR